MSLSGKQKKLIEALFTDLADDELSEKFSITRATFVTWLEQKAFATSLAKGFHSRRVLTELLIAREAPGVVSQLIALTASDNPETARKACLDVLELLRSCDTPIVAPPESDKPGKGERTVTPQQQSRMLAVLAEDE